MKSWSVGSSNNSGFAGKSVGGWSPTVGATQSAQCTQSALLTVHTQRCTFESAHCTAQSAHIHSAHPDVHSVAHIGAQ